jgi:hypothetical protein
VTATPDIRRAGAEHASAAVRDISTRRRIARGEADLLSAVAAAGERTRVFKRLSASAALAREESDDA